jgi:hypothetical protein
MSVGEYIVSLWPATSGCIPMALAVELFEHFRNPRWSIYLDLASEILIGGGAYVLALVLMHRKRFRGFLELINNLRGKPIVG